MPAERPVIYLHIGAMKTGTTFLQQLMLRNRRSLADAGYLFPGDHWGQQTMAVRDVLEWDKDPKLRASVAGSWEVMARQMLAHEGVASIFSMEFLSFARPEKATAVLESLAPADVHVILTVRDANRTIPAQWQSACRNRGTLSWPEFARGVQGTIQGADGDAAVTFRRAQGVARMLDVWGSLVPTDRLHVVTVPPPGAPKTLLWERFAAVVGVDPQVCADAAVSSNTSLGQASADLLRRVNAALGDVPLSDYQPTVKNHLAQLLAAEERGEERAKMDRATIRFAARWNERARVNIVRSGADVVGDLEDLPTTAPGFFDRRGYPGLHDPDTGRILAAAATARDGMRALVNKRIRQLRRVDPEVTLRPQPVTEPTAPTHWDGERDPLAAAVAEIAGLVREAIDLRRQRVDRGRRAKQQQA